MRSRLIRFSVFCGLFCACVVDLDVFRHRPTFPPRPPCIDRLLYAETQLSIPRHPPPTSSQVPCIDRLLYAETLSIPFTRHRPWVNLGDYSKQNFGATNGFGWNSDSWNDGGPIPAQMLRTWNEIPPNIQDLARKYRYYSESWEGCAKVG